MELIVLKDDAKRLVTGPVAIPDCPDCDYPRGEKLLSVDEIESMVHFYNTHSQLSDEMHVYGATKQSVGVAVENWTLKEPLITKNTQGRQVVLPKGTWMTTIKVTDDDTWQKIQDGTYKGFSASYMSEDAAKEVLAAKRTLIADLENPMPVTVSIVDEPCVFDAIFCSIKTPPEPDLEIREVLYKSDKAGRKISNATLKKIQDAFDNIKTLINDALTERGQIEADKTDLMEDVSMNEDELKTLVVEAVKEALRPEETQETEDVEEVEVEETPEATETEEIEEQTEEEDPEPSQAEKDLAEAQKRIKELEDKLGEGESQKITGQDEETKPEPVEKFRIEEGRDIYGRKL
ncbi:MAG TPA: XkdF-like putative serine protease domain-containing protein [Methanobacteriaceae archaeon]|nr:XkdF-like putative serine protease domain-containing protein [Methanobacteriaceae archaeon]